MRRLNEALFSEAPEVSLSGWSDRRLACWLYPFAAGAAAINLFFAGLIVHAVWGVSLTPLVALVGGLALGAPAALWAARRVRVLIQVAGSRDARRPASGED